MSQTDDSDDVGYPALPQPLPITRASGASPLVPSAPSDAQPTLSRPPPAEADVMAGLPAAVPRAPASIPSPPPLSDGISNLYEENAALQRYGDKLEAIDQAEGLKDQNSKRKSVFETRGIQHYLDPESGLIVPVRDENGALVYHPGKGPIQYDETGHATQQVRDSTGATSVNLLDARAPLGSHPQTPDILYRQNKHSGWDYLGKTSDLLSSDDPEIKAAAEKTQLNLDQHLHGVAKVVLGSAVIAAAAAKRAASAEADKNQQKFEDLSNQLSEFYKNHPPSTLKPVPEHLWNDGAQQNETTKSLVAQRDKIAGDLKQLTDQGFGQRTESGTLIDPPSVTNARKALQAAHSDYRAWAVASPRVPGQLDDLLSERRQALEESGGDSTTDPVISSIEKRQSETWHLVAFS